MTQASRKGGAHEVERGYGVTMQDIHEAVVSDHYALKTDILPNGIRAYNPRLGTVVDYHRAEDDTWNISLYSVTDGSPFNYLSDEDDLQTLRLAAAVFFTREPFPQPDYTNTITVHVDYETTSSITPVEQVLYSLAAENRTLNRLYEFRDLTSRIPGLTLRSAGGMCPFQAEGEWEGYEFYFRYRSGTASLSVGLVEDYLSDPLWDARIEYGHQLDGSLDNDEFTYLFCLLASRLDKARTRYRFYNRLEGPEAVHTVIREDGSGYEIRKEYFGWGLTLEEAKEYAYQRNQERVAEYGSLEKTLRIVNPVPFEDLVTDDVDTREYPDERPAFAVLSIPEPTIPVNL